MPRKPQKKATAPKAAGSKPEPKQVLDGQKLFNDLQAAVFKAPLTGQERIDADASLQVYASLLNEAMAKHAAETGAQAD